MAGDIFGALLGAAIEGAIVSGSDNRNKGGCIFFSILVLIICIFGYYFLVISTSDKPDNIIKGIITHKLKNNNVLIKTKSGEELFTITNELYTNKNVNDSITLIKNYDE